MLCWLPGKSNLRGFLPSENQKAADFSSLSLKLKTVTFFFKYWAAAGQHTNCLMWGAKNRMVLSTWKIWKWRWKKWCTIATGLALDKALGTQLLAKPECPKLARLWPAGSQDPELSALPCERIFPADASRGTFPPSAACLGLARGLSRISHQLRGIQGSHKGCGSPLGTTHGAYVYSDHTGAKRAHKRACKTAACKNIRFIQWLVRMQFFSFLKELFSISSAAISQI